MRRAARPAPDVRHRQRRRRQVHRRDRAGHAGRPARPAHDRGRAGQPGARPAHLRPPGRALRGGRAGPGLFTISIDPQHAMEEYLRVKTGALGQLLGSSRLFQRVRDGHAGDAGAAEHRQGLGAGPARAAHPRRRRRTTSSSSMPPPPGTASGSCAPRKTFADIARSDRSRARARDRRRRSPTATSPASSRSPPPEEMPVNETLCAARRAGRVTTCALDAGDRQRALPRALRRRRGRRARRGATPDPVAAGRGRRSKPRCPSTPGPRPSASSAAGSATSSTPDRRAALRVRRPPRAGRARAAGRRRSRPE